MMQNEIFKTDYSRYYDLLYKNKNYSAEANYIDTILKKHNIGNDILELGSGTGNHATFLTQAGYAVTGIEKSLEMIRASEAKQISNFTCIHADISNFQIEKKFDAAVALFHVISYLISVDQLVSCFQCIHSHLKANGLFVFDVWYTPAVYNLKPAATEIRLQNEEVNISRIGKSLTNYNESIVEIDYEISITNNKKQQTSKYNEVHKMKHFTYCEVSLLALISGFEVIAHEEFLTRKKIGENTWGVCFILKRK